MPPLKHYNPNGPGDRFQHTLRTEELSRDVQILASDNDDLLAVKELLGHNGGQTAEEVALAIDGDLLQDTNISTIPAQESNISSMPHSKLSGVSIQEWRLTTGSKVDIVSSSTGTMKQTVSKCAGILYLRFWEGRRRIVVMWLSAEFWKLCARPEGLQCTR
jgi:hypothetical protein